MRTTLHIAAILTLASGAALAQTTPDTTPVKHHKTHHHAHADSTGEKPVDLGPNTPEANKAYQGGGVVLQGAPGAPAPTPKATPPGQTPEGSVPN
jgi:hypothetical protein